MEIEELTTSKISSSSQLQRRMKELELLCEERQQRIHVLQAEVKQLKYSREKMLLKARDADNFSSEDSASDDEDSEVASLSESLIFAARDLGPGEQLLEMLIVSGNFDSTVVGINSSTFVLCDFYDFESQSTPLLMGIRPEYNLSSTFKVTVDGFFLRYLASESIVLEVHQAIRGDFKLIGKSSIRLSKLLLSKGVVKEPMLAVKSTCCNNDGGSTVLGTLNVVLRLSTPVSEIWQVHLRSYPQDIQLLSAASKHSKPEAPIDVLCVDDCDDNAGSSTNELQITIFACRKLRSYGKRSDGSTSRIPSSYVHYQLLGFPDVFTNIVRESSSPEYHLSSCRQAFALEVDACLLRFFSKFRFWITVFDDQVELNGCEEEDGMIGRCELMLSDLVNGESVRGWFPLKDKNDRHAGDISVLIQWKDPFQVLELSSAQRARGVNGRPIDIHSLDFDQQHALLAMFSSDMDGRVNYNQFLHYASPSEELELVVAKLKERFEYAIDSELVESVQDALTAEANTKQRKSIISMASIIKAGEKHGIFLSDAERELLLSTFGVINNIGADTNAVAGAVSKGADNLVAVNYLLLHVNPRLSCAERLLCHKIRHTMCEYMQTQRKSKTGNIVPAAKIFQKFDEEKCGRISRSAFRKCLSALGFDLMSVESEYRELVRSHTKEPSSDDTQNKLPVKTTMPTPQPGIDLDEDVLEDVTEKTSHLSTRFNQDTGNRNNSPRNRDTVPAQNTSELIVSSIPAATEFQRRKQAFMDRMKAIASASNKNLVYEQVEKKLQDQQKESSKAGAVLSRQVFLQQQVTQLHLPKHIHHDAARTVQKQFRQYKEQQQQHREMGHGETLIMETDMQLQRILSKCTTTELRRLEDSVLAEIDQDAPEAKRTGLLTKKQLSYFLSKVPSIALPPALLRQLMEYFSIEESGMVAYRSLLNFVFSTSTNEHEREKNQRLLVLRHLFFDVGYAFHIFVSAGDMKETGCISFKKFHECISRLGVQLSAKELHLVTIMFDANGYEILYHSLLHTLTQLPHYQQLTEALERCHCFGVTSLREKLLSFVNSDDGCMTQEELLRVLMQQSCGCTQFEPKDASVLFEMVAGTIDSAKRISIQELCLRLESAAKYGRNALSNEWNKYDIHRLQQIAWNCRKLICGSYSDLKYEFERLDWQERGFVSLEEFVVITRRNGFVMLTESQLKGIAKSFGVKTNGTFGINYRQFLDWTTPPPPVDMDAVEEKLRKFAQAQADKQPNTQLSDILASWHQTFLTETDSEPVRAMSRSTFVKICIGRLGMPLDEAEMRTTLYTYDPLLKDQLDCSAFLQMNWREAKNAVQAQVEVANATLKAKDIVARIRAHLQNQKSAEKEVAKAFSYFDDTTNEIVECGPFLSIMRKLGIDLSSDDAHDLFVVFGELPEKRKLNFVKFFKESIGLQLASASKAKPDFRLSTENENRLKCALEAAAKFSLTRFQKCFVQFQEFCVIHRFAEIAPSKLWRQMEANGMVELLSKRAVGLLAQKFSSACDEEHGTNSEVSMVISLKAMHALFQDFLKSLPDKANQELKASRFKAKSISVRSPITILSDLLDWCDERGVDYRGQLEAHDATYTGFVTAMELKENLLQMGIARVASPLSADTVIGQLVRQYRSTERTDAVHYTAMLYDSIKPANTRSTSYDLQWYNQITEDLRSRIRLKSKLTGTINHSDSTIYSRLDAAFNHFDQDKKGFLTVECFGRGLNALDYKLTLEQLDILMIQMSIFRHTGGGLSRTEFDSFVLDPYGSRLLKNLSDQLYSEVEPQSRDTMPRVAYLSRLLIDCGGHGLQSSLPREVFWTQLERALERQVTAWEKLRLHHLFGVTRDGQVAFKLFLKVMSQWRTPTITATPILSQSSKVVDLRQVTTPEQQPAPRLERQQDNIEAVITSKPPCTCDAILRSLYNQMSSIDFSSQVDIVEEYLRLKDHRHTGSIKMKQLKRVFEHIGLSLSPDAFASLQMYFPGISTSSGDEEGKVVAYEKLLLALEVLHEKDSEN
ncbi:unnamed protein product [Phytophthora lilii]|uniref:Unnamed protein product n=1 Tax=Phytophthora lilii TaxID=2077276 RepID=A0A9W6TGE8_9STRA|nr:unnamed protein product [Phytophthora lilii]